MGAEELNNVDLESL